jgi:hypothetical protein
MDLAHSSFLGLASGRSDNLRSTDRFCPAHPEAEIGPTAALSRTAAVPNERSGRLYWVRSRPSAPSGIPSGFPPETCMAGARANKKRRCSPRCQKSGSNVGSSAHCRLDFEPPRMRINGPNEKFGLINVPTGESLLEAPSTSASGVAT